MTCSHPMAWSNFSTGGYPRCLVCDPPNGHPVKRAGVRQGNNILTRDDITMAIKKSNLAGMVIDAIGAPTTVADDRSGQCTPERSYIYYKPASPSQPPPPEIIMDPGSPFWVDREVANRAKAEYNDRVQSEVRTSEQPSTNPGLPTEGDQPKRVRRVTRARTPRRKP